MELLLVVLLHVLRLLGSSYLNSWLDLPQPVDVHHMLLHHIRMSATAIKPVLVTMDFDCGWFEVNLPLFSLVRR